MKRFALILLLCCATPSFAGKQFVAASTTHISNNGATAPWAVSADVPFSIACWFWPDDTGSSEVLGGIYNAASTNSNYTVMEVSDGTMRWRNRNFTPVQADADTVNTINLSEWNHYVGVEAATDSRSCTLNGDVANKGTDGTSQGALSGMDTNIIGARSNGSLNAHFDGKIAFWTVWKGYALTDADAVSLAAGLHPFKIRPDKIIAHYPMRGDKGAAGVRDSMGAFPLNNDNGSPAKSDGPPIRTGSPRYGLSEPPKILNDTLRFARCREEDCAIAA